MTADEFVQWAVRTGFRGELVAGEAVAMSPERYEHGRVKGAAFIALRDAIRRAGLPCQAIVDSVAVRVDAETIYQPDVLLRCGPRLPGDTVVVPDPIVLVEVLSPSTATTDAGAKLEDYFRIPSVLHYLMPRPDRGTVLPGPPAVGWHQHPDPAQWLPGARPAGPDGRGRRLVRGRSSRLKSVSPSGASATPAALAPHPPLLALSPSPRRR